MTRSGNRLTRTHNTSEARVRYAVGVAFCPTARRQVGTPPMPDDATSSDSPSDPSGPNRLNNNDDDGDALGESDSSAPAPRMLSRRTRLELSILQATLRTSKEQAAPGPETPDSGDADASEDAEPDASP